MPIPSNADAVSVRKFSSRMSRTSGDVANSPLSSNPFILRPTVRCLALYLERFRGHFQMAGTAWLIRLSVTRIPLSSLSSPVSLSLLLRLLHFVLHLYSPSSLILSSTLSAPRYAFPSIHQSKYPLIQHPFPPI